MHVSSVTVRITEGCRKHRNGLAVTLSMFEYLVFEYVYVRILGIRICLCSNTWYSYVRILGIRMFECSMTTLPLSKSISCLQLLVKSIYVRFIYGFNRKKNIYNDMIAGMFLD